MIKIRFCVEDSTDSIREVIQVSLSVFNLESGSTAGNSFGFDGSWNCSVSAFMLVDDSVGGGSFVTSNEGVRKSNTKREPKEPIEISGGSSIVAISVKDESMNEDCWPEEFMRLMYMISLHVCKMRGISRLPR